MTAARQSSAGAHKRTMLISSALSSVSRASGEGVLAGLDCILLT